jgi:hypothetical protein
MEDSRMPVLKVGTAWIEVEVTSEPDVVLTFRGYAPILRIKVRQSGLEKTLFINAKTLASPLDVLRKRNGGRFIGMKLRLRKESQEPLSHYAVEALD